jgi:hypothetical protein
MEKSLNKEFTGKILDLSEYIQCSYDETLLNFYEFNTLLNNNGNKYKKMIVNRNLDIFNKTKKFILKDKNLYNDKFWTSFQLCCILNQLNED